MKKAAFLLFLCCFAYLVRAAETPQSYMVEYKLLYSYTQDSLERYWKANHIPQILVPVNNAVDMYDVTY